MPLVYAATPHADYRAVGHDVTCRVTVDSDDNVWLGQQEGRASAAQWLNPAGALTVVNRTTASLSTIA
jgi:hypothetical protein